MAKCLCKHALDKTEGKLSKGNSGQGTAVTLLMALREGVLVLLTVKMWSQRTDYRLLLAQHVVAKV